MARSLIDKLRKDILNRFYTNPILDHQLPGFPKTEMLVENCVSICGLTRVSRESGAFGVALSRDIPPQFEHQVDEGYIIAEFKCNSVSIPTLVCFGLPVQEHASIMSPPL